jgi:hypothetical protein
MTGLTSRIGPRWMRRRRAPVLFESFLVAAVGSFLGIRALLALSSYPQLGGNGLHIAHMLWGGLLMLAALLLVIGFLDRPVLHLATIVGGLGFGTFVDEIGKFVTSDNDYFFRPAVALIYVMFIVIFLVARTLAGRSELEPRESLGNALDRLEMVFDRPIEEGDRATIVQLLNDAEPRSSLAPLLRRYVAGLPSQAESDDAEEWIDRHIVGGYDALLAKPWFERAVAVVFGGYAIAAVIGVVILAAAGQSVGQDAPEATLGQVASTLVGGILIGIGVVALPISRLTAYRWFLRGLLVWILVAQVFVFYTSQLAGITGLAIDLVAYTAVRFALDREVKAAKRTTLAATQGGGDADRSVVAARP